MTDSAYIVQIQIDNTEEVVQVFCSNKKELENVVRANGETESLIVTVQSLGAVELANDFIETLNNDDNLNFGAEG